MRLIPEWKTVLWRSWSMRLTYLGMIIVWGSVGLIEWLGDIPISPFAMLVLTALVIPVMTILGRVIDQGIERRHVPTPPDPWDAR